MSPARITAPPSTRPDPSQLDRTFFALAHGPRRQIVAHLTRGPATLPELGRLFAFSKQALSKHVAVLEDAGMVARRVRGRAHELRLEPEALAIASQWIDERRTAWEANFDRLGAMLEQDSS